MNKYYTYIGERFLEDTRTEVVCNQFINRQGGTIYKNKNVSLNLEFFVTYQEDPYSITAMVYDKSNSAGFCPYTSYYSACDALGGMLVLLSGSSLG